MYISEHRLLQRVLLNLKVPYKFQIFSIRSIYTVTNDMLQVTLLKSYNYKKLHCKANWKTQWDKWHNNV